ncbi:clan AA aspartic protease [Scytonema hofmannii PCC 7110]|uniref:Clan AA aspartic protease n=1 Tax=Scytonema hofmannii PCC 7110 TaxID=128403 RepID=A0A139WUL8_9CYAN|nr:clan AA aspartic protease [Scytonema hofmannii]KYC36119.1 clan AA aspartic protease [Scytonema hofmannii PCC 7110]
MIHGTVVGLQARINIILRSSGRADVEIECVVDTGFEGALTLPPHMVTALDLPYVTRISANLANDMNVMTQVYLATIIWHGVEREVVVLAMGRRPLIGTALIKDYHLSVDFYEGGSVVIDEIL